MSPRPFIATAAALAAGLLFGLGLALSRMTDPGKVRDFLDILAIGAGGWDPSLAFVMAGAVAVTFLLYRIGRAPRLPLAAPAFSLPAAQGIDARLIGGAALFGLGWGLAGLCPGPAIADLAIAFQKVLPFVAGMAAGSWAVGLAAPPRQRTALALSE